MVKGLERMTYEEWLRSLGLFSLEYSWQRGDLMASYSFLKTGSKDTSADLFSLAIESKGRA